MVASWWAKADIDSAEALRCASGLEFALLLPRLVDLRGEVIREGMRRGLPSRAPQLLEVLDAYV